VGVEESLPTDGEVSAPYSSAALAATYNDFPYESFSFPLSRPDHLAAVATIFGMTPASPDRARVLELGCAGGNNIIPLAEQYPDCQFVGIDLSSRQIADGRASAEPLGLKNLDLQQGDILTLGTELGTFDYIIAHGLFSWVPPVVQDKLLCLCGLLLNPQGVAFISYNTYPGWHIRTMIRDAMLFGTRNIEDPTQRYNAAVSVLDFLCRSIPPSMSAYTAFWKEEAKLVKSEQPSYVLHDHLEVHNHPTYFHEFMRKSQEAGLQYIADAEMHSMSPNAHPPHFAKEVGMHATDLIETEQYMDFASNRMFRQTLLCRAGVTLNRDLSADSFAPLRVISAGKMEHSKKRPGDNSLTFRWRKGSFTTADPLTIFLYLLLSQRWPRSISVTELYECAAQRPAARQLPRGGQEAKSGIALLLARGARSGHLAFTSLPDMFVTQISDKPHAVAYAREMASRSTSATNRRHESIRLNDTQRCVLRLLDGKHDRDEIVSGIIDAVKSRELTVDSEGNPLPDVTGDRRLVRSVADAVLTRLGELMFLIA
jgi:methyltransferase-like protein/SAM-dependent methyltransferase